MNIKLDKNDVLFSKMIRERDGNKCVFCPKTAAQEWKMTCSHFWGRGDKLNRFNPKNCDTLCFTCHSRNEGNKQGFYREWKINQLGEKAYKEMEKSHYQGYKKYGVFEKTLVQKILKEQYNKKEHLKAEWTVKF